MALNKKQRWLIKWNKNPSILWAVFYEANRCFIKLSHCHHTLSCNLQLGYLPCVQPANSSRLHGLWEELVLKFLIDKLELKPPSQAPANSHHFLTTAHSLLLSSSDISAGASSHCEIQAQWNLQGYRFCILSWQSIMDRGLCYITKDETEQVNYLALGFAGFAIMSISVHLPF